MGMTRGSGLLEGFLARRRAKIVQGLLPTLRLGTILDIGCGSYRWFLKRVNFQHRVGLERPDVLAPGIYGDITIKPYDAHVDDAIPMDTASVRVVTMLAVWEHIRRDRLVVMLGEIDRVLCAGGTFVFTTPAGWTDPLLRVLASAGLVSHEEIDEHVDAYSKSKIGIMLDASPLWSYPRSMGHFELGANTWCVVRKPRLAWADVSVEGAA